MMQKVVIDTNVVISSNLSLSGNPGEIMRQFYSGVLQLFYTSEILAEYKSVLAYMKFNFAIETQTAILRAIEIGGHLLHRLPALYHLMTKQTAFFTIQQSSAKPFLLREI